MKPGLDHDSALAADLRRLGLRETDAVLVHSSLRSLGPTPDRAQTLLAALERAVGPAGTVLVPTLSYVNVDEENPFFDVRTTPSCVGAFPEYVRTRPGTVRSVHPTHSVAALGANAADYLSGHRDERTPAGSGSPYARLRDADGWILMVGCGLPPNTSMHGIEEVSEAPYLFEATVRFTCTDERGESFSGDYRCHGHFAQHYDRIVPLLSGGELRSGRVGEAECFLIRSQALWEKAGRAIERDPLFFTRAATEVAARAPLR